MFPDPTEGAIILKMVFTKKKKYPSYIRFTNIKVFELKPHAIVLGITRVTYE